MNWKCKKSYQILQVFLCMINFFNVEHLILYQNYVYWMAQGDLQVVVASKHLVYIKMWTIQLVIYKTKN